MDIFFTCIRNQGVVFLASHCPFQNRFGQKSIDSQNQTMSTYSENGFIC